MSKIKNWVFDLIGKGASCLEIKVADFDCSINDGSGVCVSFDVHSDDGIQKV